MKSKFSQQLGNVWNGLFGKVGPEKTRQKELEKSFKDNKFLSYVEQPDALIIMAMRNNIYKRAPNGVEMLIGENAKLLKDLVNDYKIKIVGCTMDKMPKTKKEKQGSKHYMLASGISEIYHVGSGIEKLNSKSSIIYTESPVTLRKDLAHSIIAGENNVARKNCLIIDLPIFDSKGDSEVMPSIDPEKLEEKIATLASKRLAPAIV
jgi:hypothetical protein